MRVRLHSVIVALFALAACSSQSPTPSSSPAQVPPDEWAPVRDIDSCAILDETALAKLGKVSGRTFTGASAHNCVATITTPDGTPIVARAYVGERVAPDAKPVEIPGLTAAQDTSCNVSVKVAGEIGINISIQGEDLEKQCAQARDVAAAVATQLKTPPRNRAASPFHGKDPCQPIDRFSTQLGTLKSVRRPTIINCELTGTEGTLLVSDEIENLAGHQHGEPVSIAGKEAMRHFTPEDKQHCMVMLLLKPVLETSYFTNRFEVTAGSDPCGKATKAADESTKV